MTHSLSGGTPLRWPWEGALTSALPTPFRSAQSSLIISQSSSMTSPLSEWLLTGVLSAIFAPAPGSLSTFKSGHMRLSQYRARRGGYSPPWFVIEAIGRGIPAHTRDTVLCHLILWIKLKLKISSLVKGAPILLLDRWKP